MRGPGHPTVRWNDRTQRWTAWVRFPDGSRRKVERVAKADAERDLKELLAQRATAGEPEPRHQRLATFSDVIDTWLEAGCPNSGTTSRSRHAKTKSPNTIANARGLLRTHVRPTLGSLRVDRITTERLEALFNKMAAAGYSTSTVDRTWHYLNQATQYAVRIRLVRSNPAAVVLLPEARPPKRRKSLTIEQARILVSEAIPADPRPTMWLTGLMCGLRPGELAGLRWPYVDIDGPEPRLEVAERVHEIQNRYVGQTEPKTPRSQRRIGLHPLNVAALRRHRAEQHLLGLYDDEGFVFCTRTGSPHSLTNLRKYFTELCARAGLGKDWTTYELRHSFVSLVSDQLDDLVKVADLAGHTDTRTTQGYRHSVRPALPYAVDAWNALLLEEHSMPRSECRKDLSS